MEKGGPLYEGSVASYVGICMPSMERRRHQAKLIKGKKRPCPSKSYDCGVGAQDSQWNGVTPLGVRL